MKKIMILLTIICSCHSSYRYQYREASLAFSIKKIEMKLNDESMENLKCFEIKEINKSLMKGISKTDKYKVFKLNLSLKDKQAHEKTWNEIKSNFVFESLLYKGSILIKPGANYTDSLNCIYPTYSKHTFGGCLEDVYIGKYMNLIGVFPYQIPFYQIIIKYPHKKYSDTLYLGAKDESDWTKNVFVHYHDTVYKLKKEYYNNWIDFLDK